MKITKNEHLGLAVKDIDKVLSLYSDFFHLPAAPISSMEEQGAKHTFVTI